MSADRSSSAPTRTWRERLGLQAPPPDPDEWVPVISGRVEDAETGFSGRALRAAEVLEDAGIEAQQRPYVACDRLGEPVGVDEAAGSERVRERQPGSCLAAAFARRWLPGTGLVACAFVSRLPVTYHALYSLLVTDVSIRDLRNNGGEVIERASRGGPIRITSAGKPVAELRPLARPGLPAEALLARWRRLPHLDPMAVRRDIDELIDPSL